MSAFVVEDQTINTIVNFLAFKQNSSNDAYWPKHILRDAGICLSGLKNQKAFALSLHDLNVKAVSERYNEFEEYAFTYRQTLPEQNIFQVYKSLQCWLYQCSEGTIPQRNDLYKLMEELAKQIAMYIVERTKQYDVAIWG